MSRYLILVILNTPLVIAGLIGTVVTYKLGHTTKWKFILRVLFWLAIYACLIFTKLMYDSLFSHNLTQTEPLSLFDVIEITGIIFTFFIASRAYAKIDRLEASFKDLHKEVSIKLAEFANHNK
jgi:hypothetical protein